MFALALTCAALAAKPPKLIDVKTRKGRYLRITSRIHDNDGQYSEVDVYDRATSKYSYVQDEAQFANNSGYDGKIFWETDGTGKRLRIKPADLADELLYNWITVGSHIPENLRPRWRIVDEAPGLCRFSVTARGLKPVIVTTQRNRIVRILDRNGYVSDERFHSYRQERIATYPILQTDIEPRYRAYGAITSIDLLNDVPANTFSTSASVPRSDLRDRTAIPFGNRFDAPSIRATINGAPALLEFDTGSTLTLDASFARRLHLATFAETLVGGAGNGFVHQRSTMLRRVQIGSAVFENISTDVMGGFLKSDGLVGCELLKRFVVSLDYGKHELQLSNTLSRDEVDATSLPLKIVDCTPEVFATVDGVSGYFEIDTGASLALSINTPTVLKYRMLKKYHSSYIGVLGDAMGGARYGSVTTAHRLDVGNVIKTNVPMELMLMHGGDDARSDIAGTLGNDFFRSLRIVFDYRHRLLWIGEAKSSH